MQVPELGVHSSCGRTWLSGKVTVLPASDKTSRSDKVKEARRITQQV